MVEGNLRAQPVLWGWNCFIRACQTCKIKMSLFRVAGSTDMTRQYTHEGKWILVKANGWGGVFVKDVAEPNALIKA